jgi:hypothetical protein
VSHTVSSALKLLGEELNKPAWFLDQVERWFYIMTSRHPSCALSKMNEVVYNDTITFLKDFMELFRNMAIGYKKLWKPSQTGVLISTQSMLNVQANLLENKSYKFILTSRFSQNCLENLFSSLRAKQIVPNAVQVKNNLKLIFARLYSIWLFTTSVSKMVSSVYSLLTINSMVSNFWCSRTVSKVYSKLIDYYNDFYVERS